MGHIKGVIHNAPKKRNQKKEKGKEVTITDPALVATFMAKKQADYYRTIGQPEKADEIMRESLTNSFKSLSSVTRYNRNT